MKSIFELCLPQVHGQVPAPKPAVIEEEEKQGDIEMIDSSSHRNHKNQQAPQRFQPPYGGEKKEKIQEMNMEDFMEPGERLRA